MGVMTRKPKGVSMAEVEAPGTGPAPSPGPALKPERPVELALVTVGGNKELEEPLVVYPSRKHPQAVAIRPSDLDELRGLEFLNDKLMDFYLLYITHQLSPGRGDRVHIFNTFFYTKLVQRERSAQEEKDKVGPEMAAHKRVASWTSQVDLFEKDFVLVPINKSAHWILAIVCHPGAIAGGDRDRHPGLVFLDSLGGRHEVSANVLTDYLTLEYHVKKLGLATDGTDGYVQPKNLEPNFKDKAVVPVAYPHVPRQVNGVDCGLFMCHYAEKFVEAALPAVLVPRGKQRQKGTKGEGGTWPYCFRRDWFPPDEASQKRGKLLQLLLEILREEEEEEEAEAEAEGGGGPVGDMASLLPSPDSPCRTPGPSHHTCM